MNTFNRMWGVVTPAEAKAKIEQQRAEAGITEPKNLEEQAISLVGTDIYEKLIKATPASSGAAPAPSCPLSSSSACPSVLPTTTTTSTPCIRASRARLYRHGRKDAGRRGSAPRRGLSAGKAELDKLADRVVYTGPVDAYFGYKLGALQYRSVRFETETLDTDNYQGNAVVNYTDARRPTPASSSTSTLSSAPSPRPSSAASTAPSGSPAMNPTIR
mgnify:CR=1 FL=1